MDLISGAPGHALSCRVIAHGNAPHLAQLHTGLAMLAQSRGVRLTYEYGDFRWGARLIRRKEPPVCGLYVVVADRVLVYYDLRDGSDLDAQALEMADLYFKRSYSLEATPARYRHKVLPLGLNYEVHPDAPGVHDLQRLIAHRTFSRAFFRSAVQLASQITGCPLLSVPEVTRMCADPVPDLAPRALFMVRAWDPAQEKDLSAAVKEDRRSVNEMRAACVRALRKAYGGRFTGGFAHTPYAIRHYPDVLLEHPALARQDRYLQLLKAHPVCIATTGLHGSVGWKFGEYVAFSRAIVSEKLQFVPPEGFAQGQHYLAFSTPEECVHATGRLMSDSALRGRLMSNNQAYYQQHLKPDAFVWRTLVLAAEAATPAKHAASPCSRM